GKLEASVEQIFGNHRPEIFQWSMPASSAKKAPANGCSRAFWDVHEHALVGSVCADFAMDWAGAVENDGGKTRGLCCSIFSIENRHKIFIKTLQAKHL